MKDYRIFETKGDHYGGEWPRERFAKCGITYRTSELTRSELYLALLPLINSGKVELLDHPVLLRQLARLERRTARSGKDSIDHAPGAHDDLANCCAGVLAGTRGSSGEAILAYFASVGAGPKKPERPVAQTVTTTAGVPSVAPMPQVTDIAWAAAQAVANGDGAKAPSLKLLTEPHRNFMFGKGTRYSSNAEGLIVAMTEEDALVLIRAGCKRASEGGSA
jgi:hypothetical protein